MNAAPVVLIAEDDEDIRDLISWKLEIAGYRTMLAGNGRTTLELVQEHRPDAVVLDVGMPEMSGLTVCERLQDDPATAAIPVLMLSARSRADDIARGYTVGADRYLTKPFSPNDLVAHVHSLLAA
jgi:DNA-binding response OmpR family regulator